MTHHFSSPAPQAVPAAILIDATRCWRDARDNSQSVQPCLSRALAVHDCAMLAPVLDSLISFYEAALGRPIAVGDAMAMSDDEHLLLGLLDGSRKRDCMNCAQSATRALNCALCSTRIMLGLALNHPVQTLQ